MREKKVVSIFLFFNILDFMFYYLLKLNVVLYNKNKKIPNSIFINSQYILHTYNLKILNNFKNSYIHI